MGVCVSSSAAGLSWVERAGGSLWPEGIDTEPGDVTREKIAPQKQEELRASLHFPTVGRAAVGGGGEGVPSHESCESR